MFALYTPHFKLSSGHREMRTKGACTASFPPKHATNSNCNAHTAPVDGDNIIGDRHQQPTWDVCR